jgi:hypothetical protein
MKKTAATTANKAQEVSYETLLTIAIERVTEEFGSVTAFAKGGGADKIGYKPGTGATVDYNRIVSYLSSPRDGGKKVGGKNFKFMKCLFNYWGIEINKTHVVEKKTILTANL